MFWSFIYSEMNAIVRQINASIISHASFLDWELLIYLFMYHIANQIFMLTYLDIY